jgi:predicted NBD/HSP70 family sugar kinase
VNAIGVDVGGTKITAGVVNSRESYSGRYHTVASQDRLLKTIFRAIAAVEFAEEESWRLRTTAPTPIWQTRWP